MEAPGPRKKRLSLFTLSLINAGFLLVLFVTNRFIAEASWFTMLLAYLPQPLFAVSTVGLIAWALMARRLKLALANACALTLVAICLCGFRVHLADHRSEKLRVLSFNIQVAAQGMANVLAAIREQDPDVFCLQECNPTAEGSLADQVAKGMPGYKVVSFSGMVIGSRLPVLYTRTIPLRPGFELLPIQEAVIEWRGLRVRIANVHLIPVRIDKLLGENPGALPSHLRKIGVQHEEQFAKLLAYAAGDSTPLILAGDFNSPAIGILHSRLSSSLNDSFAGAGTGFGYTIPASFPLIRMDYIYTSKDLQPVACWVSSHVASDHRAVIAEISR